MVALAMLGCAVEVDREPWVGFTSDSDNRKISSSSMMESSTKKIGNGSDVTPVVKDRRTVAALKSPAANNRIEYAVIAD